MAKKRRNNRNFEEPQIEDYSSNSALPLYNVNFKPMNDKQKELFSSCQHNVMTLAIGPAGTAKTFVSCAAALNLLKTSSTIDKIYIIKSVTTLPGEEIGFLKGTMEQKMDPFIFSFRHNFEKLIGKKATDLLFLTKKIEIMPIAYTRGISIDSAICLVDESQNIDMFNMKTLMTRIGQNSKLIILGDTKQIDLKKKEQSSLIKVYNVFKEIEGIGHIEFGKEHIVRSALVQLVEETFEKEFGI